LVKKTYRIALFSLLSAGLLAAPVAANAAGNGSPDQGKAGSWCEREFDETVHSFDETFLARDLERFMPYYHEDATSVGTNGTVRYTKSALETGFRNLFSYEDLTADFPVLKKTIVDCHTAVLVIDFHLAVPSLELEQHFVNTLTWVRDDGRWQVLAGISTAIPATEAAPMAANDQLSSSGATKDNCARKLDRTIADYNDAFLDRKLNRFTGFYHKDASSVTTSGVIHFTKADIKNSYQQRFGYEFTAQFPVLKQATVNCRTAVLVRDFSEQLPKLGTSSHSVNTLVWVRDNGRWQVIADLNTPIP